jgi:hypothetical protein
MVFIINFVRGIRGITVHRTTMADVRALGEDGGLMSWGGRINEIQISSEARFK